MFDINEYFKDIPLTNNVQFFCINSGGEVTLLHGNNVADAQGFPEWFEDGYTESTNFFDQFIPEEFTGVFRVIRSDSVMQYSHVDNVYTLDVHTQEEAKQKLVQKKEQIIDEFAEYIDASEGSNYGIFVAQVGNKLSLELYDGHMRIAFEPEGAVVQTTSPNGVIHTIVNESVNTFGDYIGCIQIVYLSEHTVERVY